MLYFLLIVTDYLQKYLLGWQSSAPSTQPRHQNGLFISEAQKRMSQLNPIFLKKKFRDKSLLKKNNILKPDMWFCYLCRIRVNFKNTSLMPPKF